MHSGKLKIIEVENNTDKPIGTVILPDNSLVLGIQFGTTVHEIVDGKKVALPHYSNYWCKKSKSIGGQS
jgi:hypothetical protein